VAEKKKRKKEIKKEPNFIIYLNENAIEEMGLPKNQMKIKKTSKTYENANKGLKRYYHNPNLFCKNYRLMGDLILLKGKEDQLAYVRRDLDQTDKWKLIVEVPLDFNVERQRDWLRCTSKFFKPLFIKESESVSSEEDFSDITQRPYKEYKGVEFDPTESRPEIPFVMRLRNYDDSAPYGSISGRKEDLAKMNKYIKNRYSQLKKDKKLSKYYARFYKIMDELKNKKFGSIIRPTLSIERIKSIVYFKK